MQLKLSETDIDKLAERIASRIEEEATFMYDEGIDKINAQEIIKEEILKLTLCLPPSSES